MENTELYHFGIKGMKWGIRRFQNKDGSRTSAGKKRYDDRSDDRKTVDEIRKKKIYQMSNAELRKVNERLQLEQQYSGLSSNSSVVKKGFSVVKDILSMTDTILKLADVPERTIKTGKKVIGLAGDK